MRLLQKMLFWEYASTFHFCHGDVSTTQRPTTFSIHDPWAKGTRAEPARGEAEAQQPRERCAREDAGRYLGVPEDLEHVGVESLHGFVVAGEELLLYGGQVQGLGDLLVVVGVPGTQSRASAWYTARF